MYASAKLDVAARSRSSAPHSRLTPDCSNCYWGEAWAWGSYLNGAMTTSQKHRAHHALQQALAHIDQAVVTRQLMAIRALESRYVA